jgi:hypothetical protein
MSTKNAEFDFIELHENGIMISVVQKIYISRLEQQRSFLEFVISFSKVYIWDLESCDLNLN